MFGLSEKEFAFIRENIVEPLSSWGFTVYVFGSRARGDHQQFSDLDLLLEGEYKKSKDKIALKKEMLEESNFPYVVELVAAAELAEAYSRQVEKDKVMFPVG